MSEASAQLDQLEQQQTYLTQALKSMLEAHWCGEGGVDAFVLALDPGLQVECRPPILSSDQPAPPPGYLANYDPNSPQYRQAYSWSCSACSLAWVQRATQLRPDASEQSAIEEIGYPANINGTYGLMDGSGLQLRTVLADYHQATQQGWIDFDTAYAIYSKTPGMMSGAAWYHWVGVRGVDGQGNLWIANSAPGYKGVSDILTRDDWMRLGGFSCVWLTA